MQFQSELAPGAVNDCDLARVRVHKAHAELEASCASGISKSNKALESEDLVDQNVFLLVAIPSCFRQSHSFKPLKRQIPRPAMLVLLRLSYSLAVVLDSIVAALDGLTGIIKS